MTRKALNGRKLDAQNLVPSVSRAHAQRPSFFSPTIPDSHTSSATQLGRPSRPLDDSIQGLLGVLPEVNGIQQGERLNPGPSAKRVKD
ncbi:hypothetical protein ElyMa_005122400 [Elysia marginata]|uniref:Uncharacterized protein n=1 Tax=Elysia marginata TaxID=1093978 RepID=A0AAV4JJN5_9GAST|nr:hypothetical protein ElyMa_005122400 [Elysia marginata]